MDAIIKLAHGYPYFLQEWGYHVWNAADESPVEIDLVDQVTPRVVRHLDENFFLVRFDRLTPAEKQNRGVHRSLVRRVPSAGNAGAVIDINPRASDTPRTS